MWSSLLFSVGCLRSVPCPTTLSSLREGVPGLLFTIPHSRAQAAALQVGLCAGFGDDGCGKTLWPSATGPRNLIALMFVERRPCMSPCMPPIHAPPAVYLPSVTRRPRRADPPSAEFLWRWSCGPTAARLPAQHTRCACTRDTACSAGPDMCVPCERNSCCARLHAFQWAAGLFLRAVALLCCAPAAQSGSSRGPALGYLYALHAPHAHAARPHACCCFAWRPYRVAVWRPACSLRR